MKTKKRRLLSPLLLWFMGTMILANIAAMMIFPSLLCAAGGHASGRVGQVQAAA